MKKDEIVKKVAGINNRLNSRVKKLEERIKQLESQPTSLSLVNEAKPGYDPYDNNPHYDKYMIFTFDNKPM